MAKCNQEVAGLPVLESCPANGEYVLFVGADGGYGQYKYALRSWDIMSACFAEMWYPDFVQMDVGENLLSVDVTPPENWVIVEDSIWVSLSGTELGRGVLADTIGYDPTYNEDGSVTLEFYNAGSPLPQGQVLIIHFNRKTA